MSDHVHQAMEVNPKFRVYKAVKYKINVLLYIISQKIITATSL